MKKNTLHTNMVRFRTKNLIEQETLNEGFGVGAIAAALTIGGITVTILMSTILKKLGKRIGKTAGIRKYLDFINQKDAKSLLNKDGFSAEQISYIYRELAPSLQKSYINKIFELVQKGTITPEAGLKELLDTKIILNDANIKKLALAKLQFTAGIKHTVSPINKITYSKLSSKLLSKDVVEDAASEVYGSLISDTSKTNAYNTYVMKSKDGKALVADVLKTRTTFPIIEDWVKLINWKPKQKGVVLSINEVEKQKLSVYKWHWFIWLLHKAAK